MEYRKELPEKSKKLIAKQFKSDILNKSTGYYKTENIFPVTSKPNELKINLKKFVPHFQEMKAVERHFNNLLSDNQRNNSFILKNKTIVQSRNQDLEILRKRAKTIKDNCYDKKGNFSCKRRYIFEFYGIDKLNNTYDFNDINNNINIIKDDDKDDKDINNHKEKEKEQEIEKEQEKEIENYNFKDKNKGNINKFRKQRNKIKVLILKSRNINNVNNQENSTIKQNYEERFNTVNNDNIDLNNSFFKNMNQKLYNKISRNKNQIENQNNESTLFNNEILKNTIANININNPQKIYNRLRTDIHLPGMYLNTTQNNFQKKPNNFFHSKDISKLFYTKSDYPVKNIRLKKSEINKNKEDQEQFTLEFKLEKNDEYLLDKLNQKNIKEIFYSNGLHLYDINEDKMNILRIQKKLEGKLRKEKNDENFDNNYKKVIKILEKKGIKVDNIPINNEKGYENKIIVKKKRKGTPGKILYDNRFHKDENTKINTGKNNFFKKNSNKLIPQYDRNYKNLFKYKTKIYKQKKIK